MEMPDGLWMCSSKAWGPSKAVTLGSWSEGGCLTAADPKTDPI